MSRTFAIAFGIGLALVVLVVAGVLYMQREDAIEMQVRILKVRTAPIDAASSVAVLDFRLTNPSRLVLEVRQVELEMVDAQGTATAGSMISETDSKALFAGLPALGPKYLETLSMRQRVPAHTTVDYMAAARFELPAAQLDQRARFVLRLYESDGKTFEFSDKAGDKAGK